MSSHEQAGLVQAEDHHRAEPGGETETTTAAEGAQEVSYQQIQGHCPSCGGTSLFAADGGHVTCSRDFTVRHPLIERVDDRLMECDLNGHIAGMSGPPVRPGRYRLWPKDNSGDSISLSDVRDPWDYEPLGALQSQLKAKEQAAKDKKKGDKK